MQKHRMKRIAQGGVAAASALLLLAGCASGGGSEGNGNAGNGGSSSGDPVVVASWGGFFDEGLQDAFFNDFTADTGIEVVLAPADWARFTAMSEAGNSEWNSLDVAGALTNEWIANDYLMPLPDSVPRSDLLDPSLQDYVTNSYFSSFVIIYRPSAYEQSVDSWADFWDTETFPGQRAIVGLYEGFAEAALLADGVNENELFPLDLDRAFEKLSEIKSELMITQAYAEVRQAFETGQVDMAIMPSGSAVTTYMNLDGEDVDINWNQNIISEGGFPFSAYGPNEEGAKQLMEYMQDPERQAVFSEATYYGSTMSEAIDYIDPEIQPLLTSYPENYERAIRPDYEWFAENTNEYIDRFSEWLTE